MILLVPSGGAGDLGKKRDAEMIARLGLGRTRSVKARMESVVEQLALPDDWTADDFVLAVEAARERKMLLLPLPPMAAVGLCGVWFDTPNADVVFHRPATDPAIRRNTIGHECWHVLCNHGRDSQLRSDELATLLTGIDLEAHGLEVSDFRAARGITDYDDPEEHEAELFATMIATRATSTTARKRDRLLRVF